MGVKGLWSLLNPVARPVQIESMEGKRLAIDSSIWLYQFQATMRDKDGRVLVNAHVLGFLRRINKLLFHGIKPVFVFDGGAPVLKRSTIAERKRKKQGAAINHAKTAEKLFAAQMRREAVKAAQQLRDEQAARDANSAAAASARYAEDAGEQIAENAVYLEELEGRHGVSAPRPPPQSTTPTPSTEIAAPVLDPAEERRKKFRKHDPYRLPETTMPTISTAEKPDARLATEEELKQFIDEVHPEDIDVESPEFRALPTEVQYEIIGDLRVRSRQQSHRRLADMLRAAPSALDFSRAQIKHLSQRNALTQQLLTVTDMVGKAHLTIPVRIAAERNREYVLVKRGESEGGGWALGIREGTKANPIKVEEDKKPRRGNASDSDTDSDDSFEIGSDTSDIKDIKALSPPKVPSVDPDLREFKRREILEAITRRYAPKPKPKRTLDVIVKPFGSRRQPTSAPLFESDDADDDEIVPTANDEALALALQQEELGSDEEEADPDLARALALSRKDTQRETIMPTEEEPEELEEVPVEEVSVVPAYDADMARALALSREETAKARNEIHEQIESDEEDLEPVDMTYVQSEEPLAQNQDQDGDTEDSMDELEEVSLVPSTRSTPAPLSTEQTPIEVSSSDEEDFEVVKVVPGRKVLPKPSVPVATTSSLKQADGLEARAASNSSTSIPVPAPEVSSSQPTPVKASTTATRTVSPPSVPRPVPKALPKRQLSFPHAPVRPSPLARSPSLELIAPSSDPPMEEVPIPEPSTPPRIVSRHDEHLPDFHPETPESKRAASVGSRLPNELRSPHRRSAADLLAFMNPDDDNDALSDLGPNVSRLSRSVSAVQHNEDNDEYDDEADDSRSIEWSRSPSPQLQKRPRLDPVESSETVAAEVVDTEDVDMNREDMDAEEDDYARFMAQIKNRDLNEVRGEIDDEIRVLNNQNKVAMRDSDEITQSMIAQIQTLLRHFGIPYITAPMEAEAQCAKLAELGLVDGIITDDSDVFLFGGLQCFKNIFNDSKYAECFLLADINRELSLSRERLISLAFLLGSDYTIGLPGVGPVVALELLANFPGDSGVTDFKEWWMKVQRGQDTEMETNTKWKKSFKKRYSSSIFLTADWPNLLVREAYKYPTTDESEEPFHWGFPKLSALRSFLHEELSWSISKVDDELTPIVQRIARRGKDGALNKQGTLDSFFDMSVASGNYAPRRRTTANISKRLMAVIKQFREAEAAVRGEAGVEWSTMMGDLDESDPKGRGTGKSSPKPRAPKRGVSNDGTGEGEVKKRKTRSRKGTVSSVAASDIGSVGTEETVSTEQMEESKEGSEGVARGGKRTRGRGRGRGRGGRNGSEARWDVVERPE